MVERFYNTIFDSLTMANTRIAQLDPSQLVDIVQKYVSNDCNLLDIGSDKLPKCALMFANWFEQAKITHYRDNKKQISEKDGRRFKKDNLDIVCAEDPTKSLSSDHDLVTAVFSIHPPDNPYDGIQTAYDHLKQGGKIFLWDYDLSSLPSELQNPVNFSKEIFTVGNECAFLGMKDGEPYTHRKITPEENCIGNHIEYGLPEFEKICEDIGFRKLEVIQDRIQTSMGERPKQFVYIGEK